MRRPRALRRSQGLRCVCNRRHRARRGRRDETNPDAAEHPVGQGGHIIRSLRSGARSCPHRPHRRGLVGQDSSCRPAALWNAPWAAIAEAQCGIISRCQLLEIGLTPAQAKADVTNGRWQRMHPGVYATFTGSVDPLGRVWAAVLYAGRGAAASHGTALWLSRLLDEPPTIVDVVVPESRRVLAQSGLRVHRRRELNGCDVRYLVNPSALPPRLRVEEAVLDGCGTATASVAVDLVLRATQRRLTTADRLRLSLERRPRHRWRVLLLDVLSEVDDGVASPLERRYRRDVEHGHRLPAGARNQGEPRPAGGRWYRDVRYRPWHVIVELDGREAHPPDGAFRDMRRDNVAALAGESTLRYGWRDVAGDPCGVAVQVGAVLKLGRWTGRPRPCGAGCQAR